MSRSGQEQGRRVVSMDRLRGLIMVLMALDHAAFFIAGQHPAEHWSRPLPEYEAILPFLTRSLTHICAPGFLLLMGAGMAFFAESRRKRGWSRQHIFGHFALRGAILILIQFAVVDPAWMLPSWLGQSGQSGNGGLIMYVGVLYALGGAMILGGLLVRLKPSVQAGIGCLAVILTQFLVPPSSQGWGTGSVAARLLWLPGLSEPVYVNYPLFPWFGVACLGMAMAGRLLRNEQQIRAVTLWPGLACLVGFFILRGLGGFGNLQPPPGDGWMAFLTLVKYPPSLAFLCLTLGANLLILALFAHPGPRLLRGLGWLMDFGRSPLFFYVLHLYLYGLLSLLYPDETSLAGMYPVWVLGLLLLLPACRRYGAFKASRPEGSVWRLL
jgi:uncharacterized membrane protein